MARLANPAELPTPIGSAPAFLDMLAHVSQAAPLNRPVLVIGERGTGKELVAGRLALLSPRWSAPFIKLNCAALPDALLDSELFGHEAGSFTGAARRRPGRFELADRLAEHFAVGRTRELGRESFAGFSDRALDTLMRHDWPGNVRELRNAVERSVYRMPDPEKKLGTIILDPFASAHAPVEPKTALPATRQAAPASAPLATVDAVPEEGFEAATRAYEARLLTRALEACRFNQAEAARRLGLSYYQFRHHLRIHGMLSGGAEKSAARSALAAQ